MIGFRLTIPGEDQFVITPDDYITKLAASGTVSGMLPLTSQTIPVPGAHPDTHFVFIVGVSGKYGQQTFAFAPIKGVVEPGQLKLTLGSGIDSAAFVWTVFWR